MDGFNEWFWAGESPRWGHNKETRSEAPSHEEGTQARAQPSQVRALP